MTLRKRSALTSKPAETGTTPGGKRFAYERSPDGTINNCAVVNGHPEKDCQVCGGICPDRAVREMEREEQRAGEDAFAAAAGDEGQRVEVSWGEELFQPVRFNALRVGPFSASTVVRKGETVAQATLRLHREIGKAAQAILVEKSEAYLRNLAQLAAHAGKMEIPG